MMFPRITREEYVAAIEGFKRTIKRDLQEIDNLNLDIYLSEEKMNFLKPNSDSDGDIAKSCRRWQQFHQLLVDVHHKKFDAQLGFKITNEGILELDFEDFRTLIECHNFTTPRNLQIIAKARVEEPEPVEAPDLTRFMFHLPFG